MKWIRFILSHSIFVSLCAAALCWQTGMLLRLQPAPYLRAFVFFATLGSYNVYWLLGSFFYRRPGPVLAFLRERAVQAIIVPLALSGAFYCYHEDAIDLNLVWPAVLLTILYFIPLAPFKALAFTRRFGILKTVVLAFTWAYVTAVLPVLNEGSGLNQTAVFIITRRFLFMLMLCIIFDSRDIAIDQVRGMRSLATEFSAKTLRWLVYIVFAVLFVSNFAYVFVDISWRHSLALQVSTIALLVAYFYSLKPRGYFFYYFFVDGLMLFSALATYIAGI